MLLENELISRRYQFFFKIICSICVIYCVFIRCYFYFYHKDLWVDECALADAIYEAPWSELIQGHIPRIQSCPLMFAVIYKFLSCFTNYSPYVLYFLPTVCGISITVLIYHFGMKLYGYMFTALYLIMFSVLFMPIYYSSEFKPYIFDCLFTVIMFGNMLLDIKKEEAFAIFLGYKYPLLFAFSWMCSSPAIVSATSVGISIFAYLCIYRKCNLTTLFFALIKVYWIFLLVASLYYLFYLRQTASEEMYRFWKIQDAFVPTKLSDIPHWCNTTLKYVFYGLTSSIYGYIFSNIYFLLTVIGAIAACFNCKKNKFELISSVALFCLVFLLGIKLYPIGLAIPTGYNASGAAARLVLYTLPVIIFFATYGTYLVINVLCKLQRRFQFVIILLVFLFGIYGVAQSCIHNVKNKIHICDTFHMYQKVSESYSSSYDLIVADHSVEYSFSYWKYVNSQQHNYPYISIWADQFIELKQDLLELIGKSNYENKNRIFFLFAIGNPNASKNVMDYFKMRGYQSKKFSWVGAELLVVDLKKH